MVLNINKITKELNQNNKIDNFLIELTKLILNIDYTQKYYLSNKNNEFKNKLDYKYHLDYNYEISNEILELKKDDVFDILKVLNKINNKILKAIVSNLLMDLFKDDYYNKIIESFKFYELYSSFSENNIDAFKELNLYYFSHIKKNDIRNNYIVIYFILKYFEALSLNTHKNLNFIKDKDFLNYIFKGNLSVNHVEVILEKISFSMKNHLFNQEEIDDFDNLIWNYLTKHTKCYKDSKIIDYRVSIIKTNQGSKKNKKHRKEIKEYKINLLKFYINKYEKDDSIWGMTQLLNLYRELYNLIQEDVSKEKLVEINLKIKEVNNKLLSELPITNKEYYIQNEDLFSSYKDYFDEILMNNIPLSNYFNYVTNNIFNILENGKEFLNKETLDSLIAREYLINDVFCPFDNSYKINRNNLFKKTIVLIINSWVCFENNSYENYLKLKWYCNDEIYKIISFMQKNRYVEAFYLIFPLLEGTIKKYEKEDYYKYIFKSNSQILDKEKEIPLKIQFIKYLLTDTFGVNLKNTIGHSIENIDIEQKKYYIKLLLSILFTYPHYYFNKFNHSKQYYTTSKNNNFENYLKSNKYKKFDFNNEFNIALLNALDSNYYVALIILSVIFERYLMDYLEYKGINLYHLKNNIQTKYILSNNLFKNEIAKVVPNNIAKKIIYVLWEKDSNDNKSFNLRNKLWHGEIKEKDLTIKQSYEYILLILDLFHEINNLYEIDNDEPITYDTLNYPID